MGWRVSNSTPPRSMIGSGKVSPATIRTIHQPPRPDAELVSPWRETRITNGLHALVAMDLAVFMIESKTRPNYGKELGMDASEWWANVGGQNVKGLTSSIENPPHLLRS